MMQLKKIATYRDENGIIEAYALIDTDSKIHKVPKEVLKSLIRSGQVTVVNLTLSSDNRLVEKEYKPTTTSTKKSWFKMVKLDHPMRLPIKTKYLSTLLPFTAKPCLLMFKLDGLILTLKYDGRDGNLKSAILRINDETGEDITQNARYFKIPQCISYRGEEDFTIDGTAVIRVNNFNRINEEITDPTRRYKTPRSLVEDTVRHPNPAVITHRQVEFIAWDVTSGIRINSLGTRLLRAADYGFDIACFQLVDHDTRDLIYQVEWFKDLAKKNNLEINGLVIRHNDTNSVERPIAYML